jgi:hypothetical protein
MRAVIQYSSDSFPRQLVGDGRPSWMNTNNSSKTIRYLPVPVLTITGIEKGKAVIFNHESVL